MTDEEIKDMIAKLRAHYSTVNDNERKRAITVFAKYLQQINSLDSMDHHLLEYLRKRYNALLT